MSDAAFVTGRLHIKEKQYTIMIDEYLEAMSEYMSEEHRKRSRRLAEERYEALRNTIAHLYGQAFLDEMEARVNERIARLRLFDGIEMRLGLLRKIYRHSCKISVNYGIRKAKRNTYFITFNNNLRKLNKQNEKRDLRMMRQRSKVRQRYNRLAEVILRDLGEEVQKELIWEAKTLALMEIIQKSEYKKLSLVKGYLENDLSFALRHLRIVYDYNKCLIESQYGTYIHAKINGNYKDCMLDYYKKE